MRDLHNCVPSLHPHSQRIESHDLRFLEVVDLDQSGDHTKAADRVEALFQDDIYDVRLASYVLSAAFYEDGPARLGEILQATQQLMQDECSATHDAENDSTYLAKATTRLFRFLNDELSYQRSAGKKTWTNWSKNVSRSECDQLVGHGLKLLEVMQSPSFHSAADEVGKLLQVLRALQEQAKLQADASASSQAETPPTGKTEKVSGKKPSGNRLDHAKTQEKSPRMENGARTESSSPLANASSSLSSDTTVELRVSPRFLELQAKLRAFETLIQQKRFDRAALVADDINRLITDFDPREYFPSLFASFAAKLNEHIGHIGNHWADKESLAWETMSQFYRVDLAAFCQEHDDDED